MLSKILLPNAWRGQRTNFACLILGQQRKRMRGATADRPWLSFA
jgi:hypothetical protein